MLELKHISKTYRTSKGIETHALKEVNLKFPKQGMVFVLGKSGSGKSTLLNIIGGLDQANSGEVIINAKSSKDFSQSDYDAYRNTYVGFIFQDFNLMDDYTIEKNIALALQLQQKSADPQKIEALLEKLDLKGYASRYPSELSGGQKQRIAIARALVKEPEILMADEPTGALDSSTGKEIFTILKELSKEKLVIVVSHDEESAKQYADRIIEFKDGEVLQDSNPEVKETQETFTSIRSHLPMKDSFKLGFSCLGHKKIRMLFTILLTSFALIMLGLSDAVGNFNEVDVQHKAMKDYSQYLLGVREQFISEEGYTFTSDIMNPLNESDIAAIMNKTNKKYATVYESQNQQTFSSMGIISDNLSVYDTVIRTYYPTEVESFDVLGFKDIEGSFPKSYEEVAISSMVADGIISHGVLDEAGDASYPKAYNDILGKVKIQVSGKWLSVSGIVKEDLSKYDSLKKITQNQLSSEDSKKYKELSSIANINCDKLFVKPGFIDNLNLAKSNILISNNGFITLQDETSSEYQNSINAVAYPTEEITYFDGTQNQSTSAVAKDEIIIDFNALAQIASSQSFYDDSFQNKTATEKEEAIKQAAKRLIGKSYTLKCSEHYGAKPFLEQKVKVIGIMLPSDYDNLYGASDSYVNKELIESNIIETYYPGELLMNAQGDEIALLESFPLSETYFAHTLASQDVSMIADFASFATKVFLYASIAFFVFATMLMMNFIIVSISYRKKEIGILRAIGARSVDVLKIFIWEGITLAIIAYVITLGGLTGIAMMTNNFAAGEINLLISPVIVTLRQPIILLVTVVIVTAIACFVPVFKVARQKPIDAIKK